VLRDGRLRTGDVGTMDTDGYVYVIDRIKDLIISGGFNVYPRMVEEAIYEHPAVAEAAVSGVADKHRGEIVMAFIRLHPGATLTGADMRGFLKDRLAPFEIPRKVEFVEEIPKTLVGKPLRRVLAAASGSTPAPETDDAAKPVANGQRPRLWRRKAAEREDTHAG
jgi:long-chain acyl-CoA synthetase